MRPFSDLSDFPFDAQIMTKRVDPAELDPPLGTFLTDHASVSAGETDRCEVGITRALFGDRKCWEGTGAPTKIDRLPVEHGVAGGSRHLDLDHIAGTVQFKSYGVMAQSSGRPRSSPRLQSFAHRNGNSRCECEDKDSSFSRLAMKCHYNANPPFIGLRCARIDHQPRKQPRGEAEETMWNSSQRVEYRRPAIQSCAVCGRQFGLIRHYSWRNALCSRRCLDHFKARRERDRLWLIRFERV